MIFETERLIVRRLVIDDLRTFHELESAPKVLKYADGELKSFQDNRKELTIIISNYTISENDFWIYAIEKKENNQFLGTVALVKNNLEDEIGYRFLEKFWGCGFGFEICKGLVSFCRKRGLEKIIGYVVDENVASSKILINNNFKVIDNFINKETLHETKYELKL